MKWLREFFGGFGLVYLGGFIIPLTVWLAVWHHRWDSAIVVALAGTIAARLGRLSDKKRGW